MKDHKHRSASWLDRLSVQTKLMVAFVLPLMVVLLNTAVFFEVQARQRDAREWTTHTYQVLKTLEGLMVQALNQETGLRGYRLGGEERFMAVHRSGVTEAAARIATLRQMVSDNPQQTARLLRLERLLEQWQAEVARPLARLPISDATAAQQRALIVRGKEIFDELRLAQQDMQQAEGALLAERAQALSRIEAQARAATIALLAASLVLLGVSLWLASRLITQPLVKLTGLMDRLADGEHDIPVPDTRRGDEIGALARALLAFKTMVGEISDRNWVKTHAGAIAQALQGETTQAGFAATLCRQLAPPLDAAIAALYLGRGDGQELVFEGGYGYRGGSTAPPACLPGEGLVGQCAADRRAIVLTQVPPGYLDVQSATGAAAPGSVTLTPLLLRDTLLGVIEFGGFSPLSTRQQALLDEVLPLAALTLENLQRALSTQLLLAQSKQLAEELKVSGEELQVQQEELRTTNEALQGKQQLLEARTAQLQASEEELRVQSESLQASNEELRERGGLLTEQKRQLETLQQDTQQKAEELARASQYKSEFLANMSHELRTPLNSLLILSRGLADNDLGHLDADEIESATVIHESGSNLLRLINDILDLSKIEAGKMELVLEDVGLAGFAASLTRNFRHIARERGLAFSVELEPGLPDSVQTDGGKLDQVVKNLLSNAFKFTREGGVQVRFARPPPTLGREGDLAIRVQDSGIGIAPDKLERVFAAFEQADGSTSRQFGGTGLGLSIARSMAQLMGGEIRLESTEGVGSTFTVLVPFRHGQPRAGTPDHSRAVIATAPAAPVAKPAPPPAPLPVPRPATPRAEGPKLPDDRQALKPGDTSILIVEDDPAFARILIDLVRKKGHRALFAGDGEEGLRLAREFAPGGILLDVMLPGMDGFSVIEALKADRATRHLPVHFISATDDEGKGLDLGAVGFLTKPVTREGLTQALDRLLHFSPTRTRRLLVVDDDAGSRLAVKKLVAHDQVETAEAASGGDALELLRQQGFDCVILDLGMAGMDGFEFLERAAELPAMPPVVVYSGRELTADEMLKLRQHTDSIVIKGARSPERLLDEVSLFLHSIRALPPPAARDAGDHLAGHTVLVVDDDMRNIFALSKALRAKGLTVVMAQDGGKALRQLADNPAIELVLMDVMMPVMDGYETTAAIRAEARFKSLPIIALTAKAMQGDREKCLAAGANDYLAKPIDLDRLFSVMRVWLQRK